MLTVMDYLSALNLYFKEIKLKRKCMYKLMIGK